MSSRHWIEGAGLTPWRRGVVSVTLSLGVLLGVTQSAAQPTVDRGASILFFPRVVVDATADTLVQISSTGNGAAHVACFFIAGDSCVPTSFSLFLAKEQPTHWVASRGRPADSGDPVCSPTNFDCDGAGADPATAGVPALPDGFRGLLVCVEAANDGAPLPGNHLIGHASVVDTSSGDFAQYSAVGLMGHPDAQAGSTLCLGNQGANEACPSGGEYDGCPATWVVNFLPDGAVDPVVGAPATVDTHFVVLPCTRDIGSPIPPGVTVQLLVYNQFVQRFPTSTHVGCWADIPISRIDTLSGEHSIFNASVIGNAPAMVRLTGVGGGIIVLPYEIHHSGANGDATAFATAHAEGLRAQPDALTLPTVSMVGAP